MNGPTNSPEHDLSRTLAQRADDFARRGGHGLDLDQVVSRAGEIRRGRRMRASIVMAAVVLAVGVPVGVGVLSNDPTRPAPVTPAADPDRSSIWLDPTIKVGAEPQAGYSFDGTLHREDATRSFGSGAEVSSVARITGGFLVAEYASDNGDLVGSFVSDDPDGPEATWPMEGGFAVSPERNVGAYVRRDGTVFAVQDSGSRTIEIGSLPAAPGYQVEAVVGESCSDDPGEESCTIYVGLSDQTESVWALGPDQEPRRVFEGLRNLAGISPDGLVAGQVSFNDAGSCSEVRNPENATLWKTCANSLEAFSPDGSYVLAGPAYQDGPGGGQLTILDARTGDVVLDLTTAQGAWVADGRWEDDGHVVAPVYDNGTWAVLRFALNGSREYATPTAPDNDTYVSPFKLG